MADVIGTLVGLGFLVLWIYCIYDVITADAVLVQHLPKPVWLLVVVLLCDLGALRWLAVVDLVSGTAGPRIPVDGPSTSRDRPPQTTSTAGTYGKNSIVRYREEQARLRLREEQLNRREEEVRRRERGET